jgi:hypothetical protein
VIDDCLAESQGVALPGEQLFNTITVVRVSRGSPNAYRSPPRNFRSFREDYRPKFLT